MGHRGESLLRFLKATTPSALGLIGVIILALPVRFFGGFAPTPILPLVVVFFWSIYGPNYLPSLSIFFIGLAQDLLTGGPPGLWAGVYLLTQFVVMSQRPYFIGREQQVVWLGFVFAAASAGLIVWLVMSLMAGVLLPVREHALQIAATIAIYPLIGSGFGRLHRRVIVEA
ncbi:MAG: hypothetical protein AAGA09_04580 [Pseudomonadota bacterium]